MKRTRLLLLTAGLSANGADTFVFNILKNIDKMRFDVTVLIAIDDTMECLNEAEAKRLGVNVVHACDLDTIAKKQQYLKAVRACMASGDFDAVHAHMDLLNGLLLRLAKKADIPVRICHAHTSHNSLVPPDGLKGYAVKLAQKLYSHAMKRFIIKNATVLAGCSDLANAYFYGKQAKKAVMVYNGIELSNYKPAAEGCKHPCIAPGRLNLVTVGRISTPKNPDMLVDIVYALSKLRTDFTLSWVGTGELVGQVEARAEEKDVTRFLNLTGVRKDVSKILPCCDYFLLPSLYEGLPVVLVEAQACGLTCFVSDRVTRMADAGGCRYLPIDDAARWAAEIDRAASEKLRLICNPEALRKFDISYTVKQLCNLYEAERSS